MRATIVGECICLKVQIVNRLGHDDIAAESWRTPKDASTSVRLSRTHDYDYVLHGESITDQAL